jgi:hypothetical protein
MKYSIGDIVYLKREKPRSGNGFIFLGTPKNSSNNPTLGLIEDICGEEMVIGIYIPRPVDLINDKAGERTLVKVTLMNVELLEK